MYLKYKMYLKSRYQKIKYRRDSIKKLVKDKKK